MKNFKPSKEMIEATEALLTAMVFCETIRPIVEGYKKKYIDNHSLLDDEGKRITDIKYAWLIDDEDFKKYQAYCNQKRIENNLHVENEECCPLLVAETHVREAKRELINIMEPITKISFKDLSTSKDFLETYDKLIDLNLKLLTPFVSTSKDILKMLMKG